MSPRRWPSSFDIRKYEKIYKQLLLARKIPDQHALIPEPLTRDQLLLIHTEPYLQSLKVRENLIRYLEAPALRLAPVDLEKKIVEPVRWSSGGTLLAARAALEVGIGINLGGGYHHAKPESGEGFCIIADIPIAIRQLQADKRIKRALIVDVDVHQGNGTICCLRDDESTFTFSMHQDSIYPIPKEIGDLDIELQTGCMDDEYNRILKENLKRIMSSVNAPTRVSSWYRSTDSRTGWKGRLLGRPVVAMMISREVTRRILNATVHPRNETSIEYNLWQFRDLDFFRLSCCDPHLHGSTTARPGIHRLATVATGSVGDKRD